MPKLRLMSKINHTEGAPVGFSFLCERSEQDATCMMDISKFSGKNITFTAYVMTEDTEIAVGLDTGTSTEIKRVASKGGEEWTPVSFNYDVPEKLSSAFIYFETNGASKLYIDDVSVIYTKDGEDPAPVIGEETNTDNTDTNTTDSETTGDTDTSEIGAQPTPEVTPAVVDVNSNNEKSNTTLYIAIGLIVLGALLLGYAGVIIAVNKKK